MTTQELLSELLKLDIKLWAEGERLHYNAPRGVMTSELQAKLVKHKNEIITRLQSSANPDGMVPSSMIPAEQGLVTGPVPLMPIVMLNYAHKAPQPWWRALEAVVELPRALSPAQLKEIVQCLITHHDNLRLRLVKENNDFRLFIAESEEQAFLECDLSGLPGPEQDATVEAAVEEQWASLDFSNGPLLRVVFFDLGPGRLPRMLILLHHFAADGYSVGILLSDFQTACQQFLRGEPVELPAKTTSIKRWAECMYAYVHSDAAGPEVAYWKSLPWASIQPTPVDHPEVTRSPFARLSESLSVEETQVLLKKVPAACNVQLLDILLTACVLTFAQHTQLKLFSILVLHHGRNFPLDGIDLFRSVGNFYTHYPLFFDVDQGLDIGNPGRVVKFVAEQRARVPYDGATWPWISHYSTEKFISWQDKIKIVDNLVFNYLGQASLNTQNQSGMFHNIYKPAESTVEHLYDVKDITPHSCVPVIDGGRFKINWEYFSALDEQATIENLVHDYLAILRAFIKIAV
jgi:hypothetical protein